MPGISDMEMNSANESRFAIKHSTDSMRNMINGVNLSWRVLNQPLFSAEGEFKVRNILGHLHCFGKDSSPTSVGMFTPVAI